VSLLLRKPCDGPIALVQPKGQHRGNTDRSTEGPPEQRDYIERLESEEFGWDLMIGDAFVRGMRDIG
jgi:hypothetical protein